MRLLKYAENGDLTFTADLPDERALPRYAILSHRWGSDTDEVTYEDLKNCDGGHKFGHHKIQFCGEQAKRDGLLYFWIDTCCIDRKNKAELSHAIRSMFRWYRRAARCYVYLSDVSSSPETEEELTSPLWESDFRRSQWFTRGWTLQELLAPSVVEFFSRQGERLGDKFSLKSQIHEITSIPHEVLEGTPLSQFTVEERFRWIEDRQTTLKEDKAYSLSGIFGVDIAPVYGEGAKEAFKRLRNGILKLEECIRDLRTSDPRDDKKRIEETKGGLLIDSYRWVLDNVTYKQWQQDLHGQLLWVKGDPGKGKTMLLCGILNDLHNSMLKTSNISYFFCQATDPRLNSATAVLRGLLYMLIVQQPSLASHVRKKHDTADRTLFTDANAWVALTDIFKDVLRDPHLDTTYLVIDALDECDADLPKLLDFIAKQSDASSSVKWIVASRNWPDIEAHLQKAKHKMELSLELNANYVATSVEKFIQEKVEHLAQEKQYNAAIRDAVLQHLISNADKTFLWVALVCQDLRTTRSWNVLRKLASSPPGLDELYTRMMHQINESEDAEMCRKILASIVVLYRPATIFELVVLVDPLQDFVDDLESVREIIGLCGSFLTLREDTVYFVHQSAKDALKSSQDIFTNGFGAIHQLISLTSLAILSRRLHRDMYNLKALGHSIESASPPQPDPLAALRYSCTYWIDHLCDSISESSADCGLPTAQSTEAVDTFWKDSYLYWIEALSLCKSIGKGLSSMRRLLKV